MSAAPLVFGMGWLAGTNRPQQEARDMVAQTHNRLLGLFLASRAAAVVGSRARLRPLLGSPVSFGSFRPRLARGPLGARSALWQGLALDSLRSGLTFRAHISLVGMRALRR